jgi:hypothetical protein
MVTVCVLLPVGGPALACPPFHPSHRVPFSVPAPLPPHPPPPAASLPLATQDCIKAIRAYVDRILKPKEKAAEILGMKALLLDRETVRGGAPVSWTV